MNKWLHKFMEKPDNTDISDKSDKWDGNLENIPGGVPDKPDRLDPSLNLSGLSGCPWGLLEENLRNIPEIGPDISDISDKPDISDKTNSRNSLSDLSGPYTRYFERNLENNPPSRTDNTDRFNLNPNMSVLSVPAYGIVDKTSFLHLEDSALLSEYEERLAIAEYDGQQTSTQAKRIAYLDSFVSVLVTLPYEDTKGDWLGQKIKAAQYWLLDQGITQPI